MLILLAHAGQPVAPHDVWGAWSLEPLLVLGLGVTVWMYRRAQAGGRRHASDRWRARCLAGGVLAIAVALLSPLDAMSGSLASAHMLQHILLVLVAAPLLALGAPSRTVLPGVPRELLRAGGRWRHRLRLTSANLRVLRHPVTVWLLYVVTLWFWHAAVPYGAALDNDAVHGLEHASFLITGLLFWRVVIGPPGAGRVAHGYGIVLVFTLGLQTIFLSMLLTFAEQPWYDGYAATTAAWGLAPLADQQLAGAIMWIPAGAIHVAVALTLLAAWLRETERDATLRDGAVREGPVGDGSLIVAEPARGEARTKA